jgi:hypothetical protein
MITINKFKKWLETSKRGDKITYHIGELAREINPLQNTSDSAYALRDLAQAVRDTYGEWKLLDKASKITPTGKIDLYQKPFTTKIDPYTQQEYKVYEYVAVKL